MLQNVGVFSVFHGENQLRSSRSRMWKIKKEKTNNAKTKKI
jgi:hypothetical protein